MVEQVPAYVCEKCGYYLIGEKNKKKVEQHERKRVSGESSFLDGLIVQFRGGLDRVSVFRAADKLSHEHEVLYLWDTYNKETLENKGARFPSELQSTLDCLLPKVRGFTEHYIRGNVLYDSVREETVARQIEEEEFQKISEGLRKLYPELYADKKFQRDFKLLRNILKKSK